MDILSCLSTPLKTALWGAAAALATALAPAASAAEIKVIASNAVREPYREIVPIFEKSTGHKVTIDWGGTVDIVRRVGSGEIADIVIIPAARIDDFVTRDRLVSPIFLLSRRCGAPSWLRSRSCCRPGRAAFTCRPCSRRWESPMS
jgi:ABC-type tungstate transport system permease subunit